MRLSPLKYPILVVIVVCGAFALGGCALNMAKYEAPLEDIGVYSQKSRDEMKIPEVSYAELATIKPGERPAIETDEAGYWMVMDQAEEQLRTSGNLVRDPELQAYLEQVTSRLVPEYSKDIRIYLVRVPHFNASMAPNGAMQIWTGLLLRVENEAQLAAVIGHEIGHYLRRHTLQRMRDVIGTTSALVFVRMAAAVAGVAPVGDLIQIGAVAGIQAFSRDQEREADGYGIALMTRAGYDPREAAKVWERLIAEQEADKEGSKPFMFLATHPASKERYKALRELGEGIVSRTGETFQLGEESYRQAVASHRQDYLRDELNLRNYDRSEKLLQLLTENQNDQDELSYFKGELYRLRGREGDAERALAEYKKAACSGSPLPEMYRAMGLLYSRSEKKQEAIEAFQAYLQNCTDCEDRQMILHMIEEMKR